MIQNKFHAISGERLSDYYNQYKSSVCLSGPVWSKFLHTLAFNDSNITA